MSTVKTKIDPELVLLCIKNNFDISVNDIQFINGGEISQAFGFNTDKGNFVIRINKSDRAFYKDKYAFENFSSDNIPIPEIIKIGKLDDIFYFAISKKAEGKHITDLSEIEYKKVLPNLLKIMDDIHSVNVDNTIGFGKWNLEGKGEFNTWKEFILAVKRFPDKENLFEKSFLERDIWNKIYENIENLSKFCEEGKYLVHGDYGNNNAVSDGEKITGVFDWAESMYGDFLYDIAWLTFWMTKKDRIKEIEDYYKDLPNFKERMLCYKLRIGLGSLSFYAYSNQIEKYNSIKQRTLNLL